MAPFMHGRNPPFEERIEQFARLVLVILLLATLCWIGYAKAQSAMAEAAHENDAPLILVAKSGPPIVRVDLDISHEIDGERAQRSGQPDPRSEREPQAASWCYLRPLGTVNRRYTSISSQQRP